MSIIFGIDIGSNSVRLYKAENGSTLYKLTETTQISEGLSRGHSAFMPAAMERTLAAVKNFADIAKAEGVMPFIFATQAFRTAQNGAEFAAEISAACSCEVEIISGELEAALGYIGAGGFEKDGLTVIDIGGASTEIVSGRKAEITYKNSVRIGAVHLKEHCGYGYETLSRYIEKRLTQYGDLPNIKGDVCGIGGTATTIAALLQNLAVYDSNKVHGYRADTEKIGQLAATLLKMPVSEIKKIGSMQEKRAEVIGGATLLLYKILKMLKADTITVSESDNLEGYARYMGYSPKPLK